MIKGSLTFSVSGETLKRPEVTAAVIWCYMDKTNELSHIELFVTLREARSGPNTGPGRLWRRVTVLLLNTGWGASVNCPILSLHLFTKVKGVFCCFKTQSVFPVESDSMASVNELQAKSMKQSRGHTQENDYEWEEEWTDASSTAKTMKWFGQLGGKHRFIYWGGQLANCTQVWPKKNKGIV